ncbi:MAG: hypothetical protein ACKOGE_01210 [Actinomycetota bacterium]
METQILANGAEDPLAFSWRPQSGTVTLQLQARANRFGGAGACTTAGNPYSIGYTTLFASAAKTP